MTIAQMDAKIKAFTTGKKNETKFVNISIVGKPGSGLYVNKSTKDRVGNIVITYTRRYDDMVEFTEETYPRLYPLYMIEQSNGPHQVHTLD